MVCASACGWRDGIVALRGRVVRRRASGRRALGRMVRRRRLWWRRHGLKVLCMLRNAPKFFAAACWRSWSGWTRRDVLDKWSGPMVETEGAVDLAWEEVKPLDEVAENCNDDERADGDGRVWRRMEKKVE